MSRFKLKMTDELRKYRDYMDNQTDEVDTDIKSIAQGIHETPATVRRLIRYVNKKFIEFYKEQEDAGLLRGSPTQKWIVALNNF